MHDLRAAREALRVRFRAERAAVPREEQARRNAMLYEHLEEALAGARVVAAYLGVGGEPDLRPWLDPRRHVLALPRTPRAGITLHHWRGEALIPGPFRIPEPPAELPVVDPHDVDVWLVPGVAFDPAGNRLGQGAGYYDRVLAGVPGRKIGVAWAFQVVDGIPTEPHDVPMDAIVTEEGWIAMRR